MGADDLRKETVVQFWFPSKLSPFLFCKRSYTFETLRTWNRRFLLERSIFSMSTVFFWVCTRILIIDTMFFDVFWWEFKGSIGQCHQSPGNRRPFKRELRDHDGLHNLSRGVGPPWIPILAIKSHGRKIRCLDTRNALRQSRQSASFVGFFKIPWTLV